MNYEELWSSDHGKASWIDNAPADQVEWVEGLADAIIEKGGEPVWAHVGRVFHSRFDVDRPHPSTLKEAVRDLVKQRE